MEPVYAAPSARSRPDDNSKFATELDVGWGNNYAGFGFGFGVFARSSIVLPPVLQFDLGAEGFFYPNPDTGTVLTTARLYQALVLLRMHFNIEKDKFDYYPELGAGAFVNNTQTSVGVVSTSDFVWTIGLGGTMALNQAGDWRATLEGRELMKSNVVAVLIVGIEKRF